MRRSIETASMLALAAGAMLAMGGAGATAAEQRFISVGTGGVTGVYYPAGGAVCRLVNKDRKKHGIRCSVESTGGSVDNVNMIRAGELDFGVVQSDVQHNAYHGSGSAREAGAFEKLRAVFSLHPEPFTVVARADSGIRNFTDLQGKRVNVGNPGSGQRDTMEVLMKALGWSMSDFEVASELKSSEQARALCDNEIDAMVFTVGHPNGSLKEATASCDAVMVAVTGAAVDELVSDNAYYRKATIPGGMYRGSGGDVGTFGVGATLVSSSDVSADVVYVVVAAVFENLDQFKKLHPAFETLDEKEMVEDGLSAPLHEGAVRYYTERGWR